MWSLDPQHYAIGSINFVPLEGDKAKMNMFEELRVWADKHNVQYCIRKFGHVLYIEFDGQTSVNATFSYNTETGDFTWYGGD